MNFEDHFSNVASTYAKYRPGYPTELYAYLSDLTPCHALAWDCATGSGQAALGFAEHFDYVFATDASAEQIRQAELHERITYRVEPAEETSLESNSVDLVTVATAAHWFDFERFYREVRRVLKPNGIIAVWTYALPRINPKLDALVTYLDEEILAEYWPERIQYLRDQYRTLPFPFDELSPRAFEIQAEWDMGQLFGFFNSWSAVRRYQEQHGAHPLQLVWEEFRAAWEEETQPRAICWPLFLRVGCISRRSR